jgi:phage gpG-like protein
MYFPGIDLALEHDRGLYVSESPTVNEQNRFTAHVIGKHGYTVSAGDNLNKALSGVNQNYLIMIGSANKYAATIDWEPMSGIIAKPIENIVVAGGELLLYIRENKTICDIVSANTENLSEPVKDLLRDGSSIFNWEGFHARKRVLSAPPPGQWSHFIQQYRNGMIEVISAGSNMEKALINAALVLSPLLKPVEHRDPIVSQ